MSDSILTSIKKMLGIGEEYEEFDTDIIIDINTTIAILRQLGVGPQNGYSISSKTDKWSDYIEDMALLELVKTYMYFKVRLMFDPPLNGTVVNSMEKHIDELEWRISVALNC